MIQSRINKAVAEAMKGIEEKVLAQIVKEQAANKVLMLEKIQELQDGIRQTVVEEIQKNSQ